MSKAKVTRFVVGDAVTVWGGPRMGVPFERRRIAKVTREGYHLDNGSEWADRDDAAEVVRPSAFRVGSSGKRGGVLLRTDLRAETEALLKGIDWSTVGDKALAEVVSALTRGHRWPTNLVVETGEASSPLSPPPFEGETLGSWRARAGRSGSDTTAAQSTVWHAGRWLARGTVGQPKTLSDVCAVLHGFGLHAPCRPTDYVSEDGTHVAGLSIYEGDLPGLMRAIGPGWVHEEVKRETITGLLSGNMLVVNIRPAPPPRPKTLAEVCDALNALQIHRDHDYQMSRDGMGLTRLRVHETALPTITEAIGPGWTITETARQPAVGDVGMSLLLDVRPPPETQPKTLNEVMSALATFQLDAGHDYTVDAERQSLTQLRMDETVFPHVIAAVGSGWTFEQAGRHKTGDGRFVVLFNVFPTPSPYGLLVPGKATYTVMTQPVVRGPCRRLDCIFARCTDEAHRLTQAMAEELKRCIDYPQPNHGAGTVKLHNRLVDLRLVEVRDDGGVDHAFATPLGREVYTRWKALPAPARPKARKGAR